jgi:hypothetical protein
MLPYGLDGEFFHDSITSVLFDAIQHDGRLVDGQKRLPEDQTRVRSLSLSAKQDM